MSKDPKKSDDTKVEDATHKAKKWQCPKCYEYLWSEKSHDKTGCEVKNKEENVRFAGIAEWAVSVDDDSFSAPNRPSGK